VHTDSIIKNEYINVDAHLGFERIIAGDIVNDGIDSYGIAWGDYNNDEYQDVFISSKNNQNNNLYLNNTDGTFLKIASGDIVTNGGDSECPTWGDYDNDGDLDLFVANWNQSNFLYNNNGDGSFERILSGDIVNEVGRSIGSAWGDYDNDGFLDLFVSNHYDDENYFFKNWDEGSFQKIENIEIVENIGTSHGFSWADYNNDGHLDLFIANGGQNNFLFRNNGDGTFYRALFGDIVNDGGNSHGVSWGDYNNDGYMDLYVANRGENDFLYTNNGGGTFTKVTNGAIVNNITNSIGSSWVDYDNDGDLDLYVVNTDNEDNCLFRNDGNGSFTEVIYGNIVNDAGDSYGVAWADYDKDGDLDFLVANGGGNNYLYKNAGNSNNWVNIKCVGTKSNTSAIGAKISAKANIYGNDTWQYREIFGQTGFDSQNSLNVEFGLGDAAVIDSLVIIWPSGIVFDTNNVEVNQFIAIIEDASQFAAPGPLVINEIMKDPELSSNDFNGEWFEVLNTSDSEVNLNGWKIADIDYDFHTIINDLYIGPGEYFVLGRNGDTLINGGVHLDYAYGTMILSNSADEVLLINPQNDTVDLVAYNDVYFPDIPGKSMELINPNLNNNIGLNWLEATIPFGDGDLGTPGQVNIPYAPIITVSPDSLNFNNVPIGSPDSLYFTIYNTGIADLVIDTIYSNNVDFVAPIYNLDIASLDSALILVIFAPSTAGQISDSIYVRSNVPSSLTTSIQVHGFGLEHFPEIFILPDSLEFSNTFVGHSESKLLKVKNTGIANLIIDSIYSGTTHYYVDIPEIIIAPGDSAEMEITFEPAIFGFIGDSIFVESNDPDETLLKIPLAGTGLDPNPNIWIVPDTLEFGSTYTTVPTNLQFYIKNIGLYPLEVEEIVPTNPDFIVNISSASLSSGDSILITGTFTPSVAGLSECIFQILSSDPDQTLYELEANGTGIQAYSGAIIGEVWTSPFSPYVIVGDCEVVDLEIQEGVTVLFTGDYEFEVTGVLTATGTEQDSVLFTTNGSKSNWQGIYYNNAAIPCQLNYCIIENSTNSGINVYQSQLTINHCNIRNNTTIGTKNGGGIDAINGSKIFVQNSLINNNFSHYEAGGIWSYQNDTISIVNTEFKDNICDEWGGAAYINFTPFYISNCIIDHNKANTKGCGGLQVSNSNGTIINSLIINNYWTGAYSSAGLNAGNSEIDLVNTTFSNNLHYGIVIESDAVINLTNNILWDNDADQILNYGTVNIKYSIIQDSLSGILNSGGTINWLTGNRASDPYFKDPSSDDYRLTDSSICINAGTPDTTGLNLPLLDLAGNPRIVFDTVDMGTYEFQGLVIAPLITQEPISMVVCEGDSAGFNVLASGTPKYYQWQKNEQDLPLEIDSVLIFNPATLSNAGNYRCIVWNPMGSDTSITVTLTVNPIPQFSLGNDTSICSGDTLLLDPGSGYANYEWQDMSSSQTFDAFFAGLFWVEVTTAEGCVKRDSINISINPVPVADFSYVQGCENNHTQFTDLSTANASSISNWFWDFGDPSITDDTSIIQNPYYTYLTTGTYYTTLVVTNSHGCSDDTIKPVDVYNSPVVDLGNDQIICSSDLVDLNPGTTGGALPYDYLWNTGAVSPTLSINPKSDTTISLIVTDNNGCEGYDTINLLLHQVYQGEEICIVTVDSASQKNLVVWDKTYDQGTAYYNVYRVGNAIPIKSVLFDSLSVALDVTANPLSQPWQYQITAVDSCGNESVPSTLHQTIHLTAVSDLSGNVSLAWTDYLGFSFSYYYIYRGVSPEYFSLIDSVYYSYPKVYTDINPPPFETFYRVVVQKHPDSICDPTQSDALSGPFKKSLSNIGDGGINFSFQIEVFLEGPFDGNQMTTELNQHNLIPRFQPFNVSPWFYPGEEYVSDIPNPFIVDWILFELRETTGQPWTAISDSIIYRQAAFIRNNGYIVDLDGESNLQINAILSDNLYLVLWHRNHLGIMSSTPLQFSGNLFSYDFSLGLEKVYGGQNGYQYIGNGLWGMVSGDANTDGSINLIDKDSLWFNNVGEQGHFQADFNLDTQINNIDKNDYWIPNEGKGCQVPE